MIGFGVEACRDYSVAVSKEWLETDGLGGYSSSTIIGVNTRRYHGLLVAAMRPPSRRMVLLSKVEEALAVREVEYDLSTNQYPQTIHPQGYLNQIGFHLDPFPTFTYEVGSGGPPVRLEKQVVMARGVQAVFVRYRLLTSPGSASLVLRPLVAFRDDHHLMQEHPGFEAAAEMSGARDVVTMRPYEGRPTLHLHFHGAYFEPWGEWYRSFEYLEELARGLDYQEDLFSPGYFTHTLEQGETAYFVASTEPAQKFEPNRMVEAELRRRSYLWHGWERAREPLAGLVMAADAFLVGWRGETKETPEGIVAGYHWFEEWGRDTMIALPGLALVTRRFAVAKAILRSYCGLVSQGMIPNRIPEAGAAPDYNTVDATLWMFWALHKYLDYSGDREFVEELVPVLQDIVAWHVRGTRYDIHVDRDGLLTAGSAATQLTWMDAKVGDWVMTPRHGKAVEINALWHHALRFLEELGVEHHGPAAEEVSEQFEKRFWNEELGYLNDVVDGDLTADYSLRPNQIIAVSLPYLLLPIDQARSVVETVRRDLLAPFGLRTLSPHDPRYRGRYVGDQFSRDSAYHQGTVWSWLLGPFITAYVRVAQDRAVAQQIARGWLEPFVGHLKEAGLGQVSEIFDGDPPHQARGCIAQAWSVGELLRVAVEELGGLDMGSEEA